MGESSHFSSRVESESFQNAFESSGVESSVFPSRVKSSQIIHSIICVKNFHNKFFTTHYLVPTFLYTKIKNSATQVEV